MNEALETLINAKADSVSTYTKTQVDTLLTDKANTDDVYSKNTMDAKLLEYATSDSVYSKQDINTMKQVNKANLAIVSTDGLAPLDIAAGQYVYFNDVMYMATEEILTGVQLVPNANIVINPIGVTNRIGDGLKNAVTQINGLAETVSNQSQQKANESTIAKVENGSIATQTINPGDYVYRNGVLYQYGGSSTIATGETIPLFSDSWIVQNGGLNSIYDKITNVTQVANASNSTESDIGTVFFYKFSNGMKAISISNSSTTNVTHEYANFIPAGFEPTVSQKNFGHTWSPRYPRLVEIKPDKKLTIFPSEQSAVGISIYMIYV